MPARTGPAQFSGNFTDQPEGMAGNDPKHTDPEVTTNNLIERITEYIVQHLANDLHQPTVAAHFDISMVTLSKMFKKKYQCTFRKYVEDVRMKRAYQLIAKENKLVKEVMYLTGYHSRVTFVNAFKRHFQKPPSAFK